MGDAEGVAETDAEEAAVVVAELLVVAVVVADPAAEPPGVQAASAAAAVPAPKKRPRERLLIKVERSNWRPRSWLGWGSCGGCGEVVIDPWNAKGLCRV
jgi:hypothetical protein